MGFGKRVGPFLLDGVLRGDDEERVGKLHCLPADGDFAFLHGLQQGRLRFGGGAVDFVRQEDVGEDRPFDKPETSLPLVVFLQHVGAGDVGGHQIRRELNPLEADIQNPGQRADHQGFGQPRHPFQQAVPAGKDGREELLDDFVLPHDDSLQLLLHQLAMLGKLLKDFR